MARQFNKFGRFKDPKTTWEDLQAEGIVPLDQVEAIEEVKPSEPTMSSREIAELTGKRHDHVLRDCDNLNESYKKMTLPQIWVGVYTHPSTGNQQHREYLLTKMQTFDLLTGYSQELRIKVNRRWEELEKQVRGELKIPKTFAEALRLAAEQQEKLELQAKQLEKQKPHVEFSEIVTETDDAIVAALFIPLSWEILVTYR